MGKPLQLRQEGAVFDPKWLNDRSQFQQNWVHGLRNSVGLHLQYEIEGDLIVASWQAGEDHVGFPGFVHGGIIGAILDDVMGRAPALWHRWVVTGRLDVRYRNGAPINTQLRVEGWITRLSRRVMQAESRIVLPDGAMVAEASGTYLPVPDALLAQMVEAWPGFAAYLSDADAS